MGPFNFPRSQIQINLPDAFNISVGDFLIVLSDAIHSPTMRRTRASKALEEDLTFDTLLRPLQAVE